jgi:hypothetical protein
VNEPTDTTTIEVARTGGLNRRHFLATAGALSAAAVLAACGSDSKSDGGSATTAPAGDAGDETTTTAASGDSGASGDLKVGKFAASLEVLAVNTYGAALDAAKAKKLGEVPPAVAEFATTAMSHHQSALDAWNEVLSGAGEDEVSDPPEELDAMVAEEFGKVTDVGGVAKLALLLEQTAASTYLSVIPSLTSEGAIKLASSIYPIDMQHSAVLLFALGEYPVPDTFGKTDKAATPG